MGIPLDVWSGARATNELHHTVRIFAEESSRQTTKLIHLTWAIMGLTVVMLLTVMAQILVVVLIP
jgi:hypothetical protein